MSRFLVVVTLASCSTSVANTYEGPPPTPYDCSTIVPARQPLRVDPTLVTPWRELSEQNLSVEWARRLRRQLSAERPIVVTIEERVWLQHYAIMIVKKLNRDPKRPNETALHRRVMEYIVQIAPTADEIATLGPSASPLATAILGPTSGITQRATRNCGTGDLKHTRHFKGLLAFRPLRAGTTRALVAQLVVYDTEGVPHVTPLVEGIELRIGNEHTAPACVVGANDDGTLQPRRLAEIDEHPAHARFVFRDRDGLGCRDCHHSSNQFEARDLTALQVISVDRSRDDQVLELAKQQWEYLTSPLEE